MKKIFWAVCVVFLLSVVSDAASTSKEKVEVVYQIQTEGHWQVFLFGPHCPDNKALKVVPPEHYSGPIEVDCEAK